MIKVSFNCFFVILLDASEEDAIDLAVKSLMDVVESGAKNISLS